MTDRGFQRIEVVESPREAELAAADGDEQLGACLYLTPEELEALGIDLDSASAISFAVDGSTGQLAVEEVSE